MRAIVVREPGDETVLALGEAPAPALGPPTCASASVATAVNRADLLQRQGIYPPPPGASPILGLECAGDGGRGRRRGRGTSVPATRVMALLAGGGYAEEVCVDHGSVIPVPDAMSDEEAGRLPRGLPHRLLEPLHGRAWARSGRTRARSCTVAAAASARRRSSSCARRGHRCFVTVGSAGQGRALPRRSAPPRPSTTSTEDFAARVRRADRRPRRRRRPRSHRRPLPRRRTSTRSRSADGWSRSASWAARRPSSTWRSCSLRRLAVIGSTLRGRIAGRRRRPSSARFRDRFGAFARAPVACGRSSTPCCRSRTPPRRIG